MKKSVIEQYNALHNRTVGRKLLERLLARSKKAREERIIKKLEKLLAENPNEKFDITISKPLEKKKIKPKRKSKPKTIPKAKKKPSEKKIYITGLGMPSEPIILDTTESNQVPEPVVLPNQCKLENKVFQNKDVNTVVKNKLASPVDGVKAQPIKPSGKKLFKSMADVKKRKKNTVRYILNSDLGTFLGKIEKKPKHSVVVTLDTEAGFGKTRAFYQAIEQYTNAGYQCSFLTLEEHSTSSLCTDKSDQYWSENTVNKINLIDEEEITSYNDFKSIVNHSDIIFIDSFGKLQSLLKKYKKIAVDEDIRKAFDGKLFFIIFQQTKDKKMRGGADSEYDADIILEGIKPSSDYTENYLRPRKHRYNDLPDLKYSIYHQKIIENTPEPQKKSKQSNKMEATPVQNNSSSSIVVSTF